MKKKLLLLVPALALMAFGVSVPTSAKIIRRNSMLANPATELTVTNFEELKNALILEDNVRVTVTNDIAMTETITTGGGTYQIVSNDNVVLSRALEFTGDMIVVSENASLTVGKDGAAYKVTFDGNKEEVLSEGSLIENFGTLHLLDGSVFTNNESTESGSAVYNNTNTTVVVDGATISNNKIGVSSKYGAVYVNSDSTLNFVSGTVTGNVSNASGAGLFMNTNAVLTMTGGTFENNATENGNGGAIVLKEDANISNVTFTGNSGVMGGALWIYNQANATISDSTFTENKAGSGGVLLIENYTTATFDNCEFTGNTFRTSEDKLSGAGLYARDNATINLKDSTLANNVGSYYGGAIYARDSEINLENTDVKNNVAQYGAGINVDGSVLTMIDGEISGNELSKDGASGGGIFGYDGSNITLTGTKISNNKGGNGGGIRVDVSDLEMNNVKVYANNAENYGAGIYSDKSTIVQNNSSIRYNVSGKSGCGVFNEAGTYTVNGGDVSFNMPSANNGGAFVNKGNLTIIGATFEGNSAPGNGGAIQSYNGTITAVLKIKDSTFKDNGKELTISGESATVGTTAKSTQGGAINVNGGELEIKNSIFTGNLSTKLGGAINIEKGNINITGSTFSSSTSAEGGALNLKATTGLIANSTFNANSAKTAGAVCVTDSTDVTIKNGTFTNNTATEKTDADYGMPRGEDIYVWSSKAPNTDATASLKATATIDGGSYKNISLQYGVVRIGGNLTVSDCISTFAGIQANYAHIVIFDELTNKVLIHPKWNLTETNGIANTILRFDENAKANKYQLLNNILIDGNYYAKMEDGKAYVRKGGYKIITPVVGGTTCPLGANAGDTVSFSAQPGYKVTNVSINGGDKLVDAETYSFTMPESEVTLTYNLELLPIDIGVDEDAKDYISVASTAKLGEKVTVTPIVNNEYRVTNVYYTYNSVKYDLDYDSETNTYSFTMFEGVDLKAEKVELHSITFTENEYITTQISSNGNNVTVASSGEQIDVSVQSVHSRYMLDLANSYYVVDGDETKYDIADLSFTMPNANVTITINVVDIYNEYENIVEVYTFNDLVAASKLDNADIIINQDIEITDTIKFNNFGIYNILGSGNRTIKRASSFKGEMFVIQEFAEVTLGKANSSDPTNTIVFDGNKENVTSEASMFVVRNSAKLFINNYVKIVDSSIDKNSYYTSYNQGVNGTGSGAIYNFNGLVYLNGGEISGHESNGYGGAILNGGYFEVNAGKIVNNKTLSHGGAIFNTRYLRVNGGEISDNISAKNGGAIYLQNSSYAELKVYGGKIANNTSTDSAGAIFNNSRSFVFIYGGDIINNKTLKGNGGAVYNYGKMIVRGGYFANNTATYKDKNGGAIYVNVNLSGETHTSGELYLFAGTFDGNSAYNGGAIAMHTKSVLFVEEDSTVSFVNNSASNRGGAIYLMSSADAKHSTATITGGTFEGNVALNGKDFAVQYGLLNLGGNVTLDEVKFVANPQAKYGYLNIISNMSDKFTIVPISYTEKFDSGYTFIRFEKDVDSNKLLDTISVKQKTGTTWSLKVDGNSFVLSEKEYAININSPVRAIDVAFNSNAGNVVAISTRTGYKVTNLKVDGVAVVNNRFTMPEHDVEITYDYEYQEYLVIVKDNSKGVVQTSKVVVHIDEEVTLTVVPNAGYYLKGLYLNGVKVEVENNTYTFTTSKNVEVTAKYEKIRYAVGYNYNYDNKYELTTYYYGDKIEKITPKRSGYTFAGWFTNVELTDAFDFSLGIVKNTQLYAKWVKVN